MNKAASNQMEDDLKIVCFDIYVSNFWKILAKRVHFLEQLQGLSLHLYQKKKKKKKNPANVFIKDFDYNRFTIYF